MPEVAGGAAVLVDPTDDESVARGRLRVLRDPDVAAGLARRGTANTRRYSWDESAARLWDVLERAAAGTRRHPEQDAQ